MASKTKAPALVIPEEEDQELKETVKKSDELVLSADAKDARIAELEKQLAAAKKQSEGYRAGNDYQVVQMAIQECVEAGVDPWTRTVSVRVPERRDTTEKSYWLMINGRSVQLPANNQYQEMKLPFAEALLNSLQADRFAQKFADEQIQVYDPITNPNPEAKSMK